MLSFKPAVLFLSSLLVCGRAEKLKSDRPTMIVCFCQRTEIRPGESILCTSMVSLIVTEHLEYSISNIHSLRCGSTPPRTYTTNIRKDKVSSSVPTVIITSINNTDTQTETHVAFQPYGNPSFGIFRPKQTPC